MSAQPRRRVIRPAALPPSPGPKKPTNLKPIAKDHPLKLQAESTKAIVVIQLMSLLDCPIPGRRDTKYIEAMLSRIIDSEFLLGKFLDKILPTLTPEQTNILMQNFETRLVQLQGERVEAERVIGIPSSLPTIEMPTGDKGA